VVSSYLRFAAGVCVLSMGLFLGATGGAIAAANADSSGSDTDSSGSTATGDDDAGGSNQGSTGSSTKRGTVGRIADSRRKTPQGVKSSFGSSQTPGPQPSTGAQSSTVEPAGTDSAEENEDSGLVATDPEPVEPVPTVVEPVTNAVEPVPAVVEPVTNVVEPAPTVDASAPSVVTPVPNLAAPVSTVVNGLAATTTDVIALVEDMLTSAVGAVLAFTALPADLSALLGIAGMDPVVGAGVVAPDGDGLSAAADAPVLRRWMVLQSPVVPLQTGIPGVTWADSFTGVAPLGGNATTLLSQESPWPEAAPASDAIIPAGVREFVQQAFDELRRSPALAALLYAALPGVGGLLIVTGAGVRLGYRQAKARITLQTAGIARFAHSGPIGVVRSGSLVYVRPRALHVVRPGTLSTGCGLDTAA
jgi:hypothetical protein